MNLSAFDFFGQEEFPPLAKSQTFATINPTRYGYDHCRTCQLVALRTSTWVTKHLGRKRWHWCSFITSQLSALANFGAKLSHRFITQPTFEALRAASADFPSHGFAPGRFFSFWIELCGRLGPTSGFFLEGNRWLVGS